MQQEIEQIEADLAKHGVSVTDFCQRIGIARSTWTRWRSGATDPNMKTWRAAVAAFDEIVQGAAA